MSETVRATRLVLVVDDDAGVRDVVITLLELSDHDVLAASGGAEALRMLAANSAIDLVVSDVRMPGMSGLELATQVGARHPGVPVILDIGTFPGGKRRRALPEEAFQLRGTQGDRAHSPANCVGDQTRRRVVAHAATDAARLLPRLGPGTAVAARRIRRSDRGVLLLIPVALGYFVLRRQDLAFSRVFQLFAVFILACGTTHLLEIWTLWHADYVLQGVLKAATAVVSLLTAALLWPLIPKALLLPSPAALQQANDQLREVIAQKDAAVEDRIRSLSEIRLAMLGGSVRLHLDLADDLWVTQADPGQSDSALLNLVVNGRDAMPEGGMLAVRTANVSLDATTHDAAPGDHVALCVTDAGIGMTDEARKLAFEPFFPTKPIGSSGLGLSRIYGFVRQSHGHVAIESAPGQGTTVTIYLRRASAGEEARGASASLRVA